MNTMRKAFAVLAVCGFMAGCATTQQQQELADIRAIAEQAAADAAAATQAATAAQSRADAALEAANSAKAQSADTEAKIDRMFKKAMYK
jgi:murein lipoprotein